MQFYTASRDFSIKILDKYINQIHVQLYDEEYNSYVPEQEWSLTLDLMFYESYLDTSNSALKNELHKYRFPNR